MKQSTTLDTQIINSLNSTIAIFKFSDSKVEAIALGILEGVKLAGGQAPLLELAYINGKVKLYLAGEL
ncbi:MAG: hypothetical protein Q8S46_02400 [Methylotenera sp.]|nr:hypothetical protein [Methylotenera sp.]MDP1595480.1 hypothetical protein [Methylotenera sp.]MDP1959667.1 hypothetical protein [Methylotenera sp.]MDP3302985.1 hypothetical protein [Methylotenera sp.]MDP3943263.1 hypothetical protein [Methylotenera sp.]